jgi:hypothetical protein
MVRYYFFCWFRFDCITDEVVNKVGVCLPGPNLAALDFEKTNSEGSVIHKILLLVDFYHHSHCIADGLFAVRIPALSIFLVLTSDLTAGFIGGLFWGFFFFFFFFLKTYSFVNASHSAEEVWRTNWTWQAFWQIIFFITLVAVSWLWRPRRNNVRYGYSELGIYDDDDTEVSIPTLATCTCKLNLSQSSEAKHL